jgi:hypothetical protein
VSAPRFGATPAFLPYDAYSRFRVALVFRTTLEGDANIHHETLELLRDQRGLHKLPITAGEMRPAFRCSL